ncbi:MAG: methyltransferase type 12 [Wenzhouxiangellaceae bacterium]|nr:methyltransferase type 12 [Wenzhouxiangellaceae bacterium]
MDKGQRRQRARSNNSLDFFRGFLKDPRQVGSVIPSSRFMERKIIEYSELDDAKVVVELGPGTGGTTRALLTAMRPDARLLTIDLAERFTRIVAAIGDPRLIAHTGSAAQLESILVHYGLPAADVVISGIPFSTMPGEIGREILQSVCNSLSPGGVFVAYQFRGEVARLAEPVFGMPARSAAVPINIPPMRIWQWCKPDVEKVTAPDLPAAGPSAAEPAGS